MPVPVTPQVFAGVGNFLAYKYGTDPKWTTRYRLTSDRFVMLGRRPPTTAESGATSTNVNVPLDTPAWTMTELTDHWSTPKLRGQDIVIPYAHGEQRVARQVGGSEISIELAVNGDYRPDGTLTTNPQAGLARNIEDLRQLQANTYQFTDWTDDHWREFWYIDNTDPSFTSTYSGMVQIERIRFVRAGPSLARAVLTITAAEPLTPTSNRPARDPATST